MKEAKPMTDWNVCPGCGTYWDGGLNKDGVCRYCGFDRGKYLAEPKMNIPEKCEEHPKYEGIGTPKTDCLTCWMMHKGYTDNKVKELKNASDKKE